MTLLHRVGAQVAARQELALVGMLVLTLTMMILPLPPVVADILIAVNMTVSLLMMMVAIHIKNAVEFSTLPSLILLTTTFRLALSITTSRMVLVQGDAGEIINTFGEFVISGNVVVGLVVYLIITIVQFLVISKGSERVAEVAARFTLDALPGKQISIDTDVKNGDIDKDEARRRRASLAKESQLFGAMDGAMKFVKGDSIASLIIIVINLVGGIIIAVAMRGMSFPDAVHNYSLLAVGDGLIAQIPALLISLTAGLTVTRSNSDDGNNLGQDIASQIGAQPRTLQIGAVLLILLGLIPGFPIVVFFTLAAVVGGGSWLLTKRARRETAREFAAAATRDEPEPARITVALPKPLRDKDEDMGAALDDLRRSVGDRLGMTMPRLRVTDATEERSGWLFSLDGVPIQEGDNEDRSEVLAGLDQALSGTAERYIGIQETKVLLEKFEKSYPDLVGEAKKDTPLPRLAEVLRRLLEEQVSITNLRVILEAVSEWGSREEDTAALTEHVRTNLRNQICFNLAGADKVVPILLIDPQLDKALRDCIHSTDTGSDLLLDHDVAQHLVSQIDALCEKRERTGATVAVLARTQLRRHLRSLLKRYRSSVPVISHGELSPDFEVDVVATIPLDAAVPPEKRAASNEAA